MLTQREEQSLVLILSLLDLGGRATKAEVLGNVLEKGYLKLTDDDFEILPSRNEEKWRNSLAFVRQHLKDEGYIYGLTQDIWDLNPSANAYVRLLAEQAVQLSSTKKISAQGIVRARSELVGIVDHASKSIRERVDAYDSVGDDNVVVDTFVPEAKLSLGQAFEPQNVEDARDRIAQMIVLRRGQTAFRRQLLRLYNGRCAITGCNVEQVLETAHIIPYRGQHTNHPANGLLLRADIHTLFDLGLIAVAPETMTVLVSPQLRDTDYSELSGKCLLLPEHRGHWPNKEALDIHRREAGLEAT